MEITLKELANRLDAVLEIGKGSDELAIKAVNTLTGAGPEEVTFLSSSKLRGQVAGTRAGAIIVQERIAGVEIPQLVVGDVNHALMKAQDIFAPILKRPRGIDESAKVASTARLGQNVYVGPGAVIDDNVKIGDDTVVSCGCRIGENTVVGKNCRLDSNAVIYHNCFLGDNVIIQANSTIGGTGFGYRPVNGMPKLIPHNGSVVIENDVEIGANSCVDRAKFGETRIGAGTKIDNIVQIGHNVTIGRCCLIAALVGIAGSVKIGDGVIIAGLVGVIDNLRIGDGVKIGANSIVCSDVASGQEVLGYPAREAKNELKAKIAMQKLPELIKEVRQLRSRIEELETAEND